MTIPKRTVSFSNDETGTDWRLVTAKELAALEARKPQVPAEVIARTQGALIGWQNADEFDTEELQEHGDVLRDATRALLAAVEAAPPLEGERLAEADLHKLMLACSALSPDGAHHHCCLRPEMTGKRRFIAWLCCQSHPIGVADTPLAAVQALHDELTGVTDFASMNADDLRAWLDERGRLYEGRATGEEVLFHAWFDGGGAVGAGRGSTREAALLELCQKVAAKEAS